MGRTFLLTKAKKYFFNLYQKGEKMEAIADIFYKIADENKDKIAITCEEKSLTYLEFSNMVSKISQTFEKMGVNYGDILGVAMDNSIESVALIFSAMDMGICLLPFSPASPESYIKNLIKNIGLDFLVAKKNFLKKFDEKENNIKLIQMEELYDIDKNKNYQRIKTRKKTSDEKLFIVTTSGSTGNPKPIVLTQKNKLLRARAHIDYYNICKDDVILAATPLYHSLAMRLVIMPLIIGAKSVLMDRYTPQRWIDLVSREKVSFTIAVSSQLCSIANLLNSPFLPEIKSLKKVVSSSALLEKHIKEELIDKLDCDFHEMYGTSETSTVTDIGFSKKFDKKNSVGKSFAGADIIIIDDEKKKLKKGEIGQICCKTPLICDGYYKMQDKFLDSLQDGYFKTGDLGYLDEDGYLYYSSRKKDLIITGGINIFPQDIESVVKKLDEVSEVAAFGYQDDVLGEVLSLAIVLKKDANLTKRDIRIHCARNLNDYQQPHNIFFLDKLPTNDMGKLTRTKLSELYAKHLMELGL